MIRSFIPNLFTSLNLFCGLLGIILSFNSGITEAFFCILLAAIFDFLDGFLARLLNAKSEIGAQLDSLADMVTFGALPGILLFHYLSISFGEYYTPIYQRPMEHLLIESIGLLVAVLSALRLAKFNADTEQTNYFKGLNVPTNALFIGSLGFIMEFQFHLNFYQPIADNVLPSIMKMHYWDKFDFYMALSFFEPTTHIVIVLLSSFLLVSPIKMFSLKLKSAKYQDNKPLYWFLMVMVFLGILNLLPVWFYVRKFTGFWPTVDFLFIPFGVIVYILMSLIGQSTFSKNEV